MNYKEAIAYIENIPRFATNEPLEHAREMLHRLGNPQDSFKSIHVAGTNGKGSVCAYLDAMFREGGFKCGLFTSPHLIRVNERFKVNGCDILNKDFLRLFKKVKVVIDEMLKDDAQHPSYFEVIFAIGMLYFKEQDVDIAIIETGLGGRLDATNAINKPIACVITAIGLDHTEYLGDTIKKITGEKAGIIKANVPVIFEKTNAQVAKIIKQQANALGAPAHQLDDSMYKIIRKTSANIDFSLQCKYYKNSIMTVDSCASYQMSNAALALLTMAVLWRFHHIQPEALIGGLKKTKWPGRMEEVLTDVILDGAHNEDGINRFIETAVEIKKKKKITILFTTVSDKNYATMIHLITAKIKPATVVTTQVSGLREVSAQSLAKCFEKEGCKNVYACEGITTAFEDACVKKDDGILFCIGSLYMVGAIKARLEQLESRQ